MSGERSKAVGVLLFACGAVLTGLALWTTATAPDGWQLARELLKLSLPTCGLGLLLGTGIIT